jgi:hypothetical protein
MRNTAICFGFTALFAALLSGCMQTTTKMAWEHYDECATETSSFRQMVDCGKARRMAYCQETLKKCSDIGNSIVQYADALSESVAKHEMTEAQAKQKFIEFKTAQAMEVHKIQAQAAAAAAASGPVTCTTTGGAIKVTNCY